MIRHKQLTPKEREELAKYAVEHGINVTAILFGKHYSTVKRWHDRYLNDELPTNLKTTPLTLAEHKYLLSISHLVGNKSLREIKVEYSLPYSIDTLTKYYKQQNIPIEKKYLLILKCPKCKELFRAINVYFGRPRDIKCPLCEYPKLDRLEYLQMPFYNPRSQDFFFSQSKLFPINSNNFNKTVLPLLKIPKDLKCLFLYNIKPRRHNRIHPIKYYEKIGANTVPVTYCGVEFPKINKREILNPRSREIETSLICQNCQLSYFRDYKKYGDRYPDNKVKLPDPLQIALELFFLAQKYNNKDACILMGISKKGYYKYKKQYPKQFNAIRHFIGSIKQ